jgi:PleD family two-component response regulator
MRNIEQAAKIWVVDDDSISRAVLSANLAKWGYDVVAFSDGQAAWRSLQMSEPPLLAILDWMMPEMDGLEICKKIRSSPGTRSAYVILLTARESREDLILGLQAGADDYISKPFDAGVLRARVEVGLRVLRLQKEVTDQVRDLENALKRIKQLQGLLPICSYCKRIRDDQNYWQQVESYISQHSEAQFSHGICPECYEKFVKLDLERLHQEVEPTP